MRPALAVRVVFGGTVGLLGAILIASTFSSGRTAGPGGTPNPAITPGNPKLEAANRNTPPPAPPTQRPWNARTPADVLANLPSDQNFAAAITALSSGVEPDPRAVGHTPVLGAPIYVRGVRSADPNEYLVPINVGATTIALMKVGVDGNGFGRLDAVRGWSTTSSFPATSEAAAIARGSAPSDSVVKAELAWTTIRGLAGELQPFWLLTRASGAAFVLFEDGSIASASDAGL